MSFTKQKQQKHRNTPHAEEHNIRTSEYSKNKNAFVSICFNANQARHTQYGTDRKEKQITTELNNELQLPIGWRPNLREWRCSTYSVQQQQQQKNTISF